MYTHTHTHKKMALFRSFQRTQRHIVPENAFVRTLGSHRSYPAQTAKWGSCVDFPVSRSSLCVFWHVVRVFCVHIMNHLECETDSYNSVEVLSVSDSLACHRMNHMTAYLNRSRPLIPKK